MTLTEGQFVHVVTASGQHRPGWVVAVSNQSTASVVYIASVSAGAVTWAGIQDCPRTEKGAHVNGSWHWKEHH